MNLTRESVLILNRNWQAIHVKSAADALSMMYTGTATGLDVVDVDNMIPCTWDNWISLPFDEKADYISTVRGKIKIPKIIVLCTYNQVPRKRPKFSSKAIWNRDNGTCQYTGRKLTPNEANIDHVLPRSKGGKTDWTNCVLSHKKINSLKGDKMLEEIGLKLIREPVEPRALPTTFFITNKHQIPEWDIFLKCNN
jgi:5-methylcytosine-specific restriction endonuclease McrA